MAISPDSKYLVVCSDISDGTVTEHGFYAFELQGTKDPLFLNKATFLTDSPQDWIKGLSFDTFCRGSNLLTAFSTNSCMAIHFSLRNKHLDLFSKELILSSPDQEVSGPASLTLTASASLAPGTAWVCLSDNRLQRLSYK